MIEPSASCAQILLSTLNSQLSSHNSNQRVVNTTRWWTRFPPHHQFPTPSIRHHSPKLAISISSPTAILILGSAPSFEQLTAEDLNRFFQMLHYIPILDYDHAGPHSIRHTGNLNDKPQKSDPFHHPPFTYSADTSNHTPAYGYSPFMLFNIFSITSSSISDPLHLTPTSKIEDPFYLLRHLMHPTCLASLPQLPP